MKNLLFIAPLVLALCGCGDTAKMNDVNKAVLAAHDHEVEYLREGWRKSAADYCDAKRGEVDAVTKEALQSITRADGSAPAMAAYAILAKQQKLNVLINKYQADCEKCIAGISQDSANLHALSDAISNTLNAKTDPVKALQDNQAQLIGIVNTFTGKGATNVQPLPAAVAAQ